MGERARPQPVQCLVCVAPGVEEHGGLYPLYHVGCPLPSGDFSAQLCGGRDRGRARCPGVSHPPAAGGVCVWGDLTAPPQRLALGPPLPCAAESLSGRAVTCEECAGRAPVTHVIRAGRP